MAMGTVPYQWQWGNLYERALVLEVQEAYIDMLVSSVLHRALTSPLRELRSGIAIF